MAPSTVTGGTGIEVRVDGRAVTVCDDRLMLLDVLRDHGGVRSVKDGCSPQGQCGCCTVLVNGRPRVSCVTPVRRVQGCEIVTLDGLDPAIGRRWAAAFSATGGSQCGFCTPGIICRFQGLVASGADHDDREAARRALAAHLCRCTGWQPIVDAWVAFPHQSATSSSVPGLDAAGGHHGGSDRDSADRRAISDCRAGADRRASIEGRSPQVTGPHVARGAGGFADDSAPLDSLVAVPRSNGEGWALGETLAEARAAAGKVQGRRTTASWDPPIEVPPGNWDVTLRTSWVEPGYLETDAAWCSPGASPVSPLGNGGAFGGKLDSPVLAAARRLADRHKRPVRVLWSREDVVARGPKRPPVAAGVRADGSGIIRVARTHGIAEIIKAYAPEFVVEEVAVAGPPTSAVIRGAGWVEAAVLRAAARRQVAWITAPDGGSATASIDADGSIGVVVRAGPPLDATVLRSYCTGAAHMALSWVTSESLSVDPAGLVHDLTIRSFGILKASAMPAVDVTISACDPEPVNGSDAVFAAVAAAAWLERGLPEVWPAG